MLVNRSLLLGALFLISLCPQPTYSIDFIPCHDARLNQVSDKLTQEEIISDKIKALIHSMLVLSGYESDPKQTGKKGVLVGIAAPQVGVMKQIIIIDPRTVAEIKANPGKATYDILINPEITWKSDEFDQSYEGCFSVPEKYIGVTKRPKAVEVEALDREGNFFKKRYEGLAAFVVQHEIDHLNGIRFPERLESEKMLHILKDESEILKYRKHWKNWSKHATFKEWQEMKNGAYKELLSPH